MKTFPAVLINMLGQMSRGRPPADLSFEGVSPSFSVLAEQLKCAQNAHGVNKIDFLRNHQ